MQWYQKNKRDLPWRASQDPYAIWVSEIMLQQTRVETVIPYYHAFMQALPTVDMLAGVDDQKLFKLWQGLGYYSRAANMKKAAGIIVKDYNGRLPQNAAELQKLSGIGTYTSGAIASIAFGQKVPAADGNVFRVFVRLTAEESNILKTGVQKKLRTEIEGLLPEKKVGDFNQALIELGALVCIGNGMPRCGQCPVIEHCQAYRSGIQERLPNRVKNKERKIEQKSVVLLTSADKIALAQRKSDAMLANLWEYPVMDGFLSKDEIRKTLEGKEIFVTELEEVSAEKAIFSHREWHMKVYLAETDALSSEYTWKVKEEIAKYYPIASAYSGCWKYLPE